MSLDGEGFDIAILLHTSTNELMYRIKDTVKIYLINPGKRDIAVSAGIQLQQITGVELCRNNVDDDVCFSFSHDVDTVKLVNDLIAKLKIEGCRVHLYKNINTIEKRSGDRLVG